MSGDVHGSRLLAHARLVSAGGFKSERANGVRVKAAPLHRADRIGLASEAALHDFAETKLGNKAARVPVLSVKDLLKDL